MFGFGIYKWNVLGKHVGWAAIRPGSAPDDFEVLRYWPATMREAGLE